jgi:hypothetical protein
MGFFEKEARFLMLRPVALIVLGFLLAWLLPNILYFLGK